MTTVGEYDRTSTARARYFDQLFAGLSPTDQANPDTAELINQIVDRDLGIDSLASKPTAPPDPDAGLFDLVGLGKGAPTSLGKVPVASGVSAYDDQLVPERIQATADLYYLYMNERTGVFEAVWKLQELFRAGTLRISTGDGALALYRFDKHAILRYRLLDRLRAYRRVFGYTRVDAGPNARPNAEFHGLFTHIIAEVAKFWRDKRISEVIRDNANDPTFGSIAVVRRAGLDLRNNVKNSSYGYVHVLRVETQQALDEAFRVLSAEDIRAQFGAENAWDLVELVLWQYFGRSVAASTMNRMAISGRDVLRWLGQPYVLKNDRGAFESGLQDIAESAEEWISSEHGLRMSRPTPPARNVYRQGPPPGQARRRRRLPSGTG